MTHFDATQLECQRNPTPPRPSDPGKERSFGAGDGAVLDQATVKSFRIALLRFFAKARRDLPWRKNQDPYRVLVSEVMLQQTRTETVVPYFRRWMKRFPELSELAAADEQEVLRLWQGLGYYSRARNLHTAVREIVNHLEGRIPDSPEALQALPGIGPYTAGAVASIAFGVMVPAVDGNVRRVLARVMDHPAPSPTALREWARSLVDPVDPGNFNQALMELGSQICTPRRPRCECCPIGRLCRARRSGTQEKRPAPPARKPVPRVTEALAALRWEGKDCPKVLLRRRPRNGLLGGMWELPGAQVHKSETPVEIAKEIAVALINSPAGASGGDPGGVASASGGRIEPTLIGHEKPVDHAFTHRRVRYIPFLFLATFKDDGPVWREDLRWVDSGEANLLPIPVAQSKVLSRIF